MFRYCGTAADLAWIWALLDLVTIVILGSGLYLWLGCRRPSLLRRGVPRSANAASE